MRSFHTGINNIKTIAVNPENHFNDDILDKIKNMVANEPNRLIQFESMRGSEIIVTNENGQLIAKQLKFEQDGKNEKSVLFDLNEVSDGTIRLLQISPAL